jgi:PAS domain S-box-containing protein
MSTDTSVPQPALSGFAAADVALFAELIKEAPIGFAFFDGQLRCSRVNEGFAEVVGVSSGTELLGRRPSETLPEPLGQFIEDSLRTVLADDRPLVDADLSLDPHAGAPAPADPAPADPRPADERPPGDPLPRERHWSSWWFPVHDDDGAVTGVALLAVDVTDRRRAEDTLRRKEERYRSLVEASSQVVWVTDATGRVTEDAPEWRSITGQAIDDYLEGGWLAVVHPEDRARIEAVWRECVTTRRTFQDHYRVRTKTGTHRQFEVRAVPIWRGDEVIEWVGANADVTGQREAEEMRGRLTEQLSAAALRTARLQQATSMLAEALTVSQVVQVITEVGRSAIGADRSAVALLDDAKLRLRIVTPSGEASGLVREDIAVSDPTVLSVAVRESRPFLAENPDSLRLQLGRGEMELFLRHTDERAWVGLPLLAAGAPIGALRFSFTRPRGITEEERVFL